MLLYPHQAWCSLPTPTLSPTTGCVGLGGRRHGRPLGHTRKQPVQKNGWGAVVYWADRALPPTYFFSRVPPEVLVHLAARDAYIFALEALAQVLPCLLIHGQALGAYLSFIDNTAAQHALSRGSSSNPAVNTLVGWFWSFVAKVKAYPYFERVSSTSNCSDGISRGVFDFAKEQGWRHVDVNFAPVYAIMRDHLASTRASPKELLQRIEKYAVSERIRLAPLLGPG